MKFFRHLFSRGAASEIRNSKFPPKARLAKGGEIPARQTFGGRNSKAFSVLEIMVAVAVLAILMLMSAKLFDLISTAWRAQESQSDVFINARLSLDFMAREISAAMAAANDNRPYSSTDRTSALTMWYKYGSSAVGTAPYDAYSDQVYFVSPVAPSTEATDLAEIGYYLRYDSTNKTYQLLRQYTNYSNGNCPGNANSPTTSGCWDIWNSSVAPVSAWYNTPDPGNGTVSVTTPYNANATNATTLSFNVWSLQVQCYGKLGYESSNGSSAGASPYNWDGTPPQAGTATSGTLPTSVQITIKVFDQRTAQKVNALGITTSSTNWGTVVGPNSRTFSTRVQIPNSLSNWL